MIEVGSKFRIVWFDYNRPDEDVVEYMEIHNMPEDTVFIASDVDMESHMVWTNSIPDYGIQFVDVELVEEY